MAGFTYQYKNANGQICKGSINANSIEDAKKILVNLGQDVEIFSENTNASALPNIFTAKSVIPTTPAPIPMPLEQKNELKQPTQMQSVQIPLQPVKKEKRRQKLIVGSEKDIAEKLEEYLLKDGKIVLIETIQSANGKIFVFVCVDYRE